MEKYIEKECKKHGLTSHKAEKHSNKNFYYRCIACSSAKRGERRRKVKQRLVEEFGGACKVCGYNRSIRNLHFHHVDPSTKEFGIAQDIVIAYERLLEEAKKCVLLCSNCHGEVEDGLIEVSLDN